MSNGGAGIDNTARHYIRQAMGKESAVAPAGSSGTIMLSNVKCYQIHQRIVLVIWT